jgi:tetratricopeptide (TPR) repeat protein
MRVFAGAVHWIVMLAAVALAGCPPPRCSDHPRAWDSPTATHVLVASFVGNDAEAAAESRRRVTGALRDADVVAGANLEVVEVADALHGHEEARVCADTWKADVVVWGSFDTNPAGFATTVPFTFRPRVTVRLDDAWLRATGNFQLTSLGEIDLDRLSGDDATFMVMFVAGIHALRRGEVDLALALFQRARGEASDAGDRARLALYPALAELHRGQYAKALRWLEMGGLPDTSAAQAVRTNVDLLRGIAAEGLGDLPASVRAYRRVIGSASGDTRITAVMGFAAVLLRQGRYEEALGVLDDTLGAMPSCAPGPEAKRCVMSRFVLAAQAGALMSLLGRAEEGHGLMESILGDLEEQLGHEALEKMFAASAAINPLALTHFDAARLKGPAVACGNGLLMASQMTLETEEAEAFGDRGTLHEMFSGGELEALVEEIGFPAAPAFLACGRAAYEALRGDWQAVAYQATEAAIKLREARIEAELAVVEIALLRAIAEDAQGRCALARQMVASQLSNLAKYLGEDAPTLGLWRAYAAGGEGPWRARRVRIRPCEGS